MRKALIIGAVFSLGVLYAGCGGNNGGNDAGTVDSGGGGGGGGGGGTDSGVDAGHDAGTDAGTDAGMDAGMKDAGMVVCTADQAYGDAGVLQNQYADIDNKGNVFFVAPLNGDATPDLLQIELYPNYGVFSGGPVTTGVFPITGDETNYATCGVCVRVLTDADVTSQNFSYVDDYFASSGTVTITEVNGRLTGSISNVLFDHVTIDPNTFDSTPVGDCATNVGNASFDEAYPVTDGGTVTDAGTEMDAGSALDGGSAPDGGP